MREDSICGFEGEQPLVAGDVCKITELPGKHFRVSAPGAMDEIPKSQYRQAVRDKFTLRRIEKRIALDIEARAIQQEKVEVVSNAIS